MAILDWNFACRCLSHSPFPLCWKVSASTKLVIPGNEAGKKIYSELWKDWMFPLHWSWVTKRAGKVLSCTMNESSSKCARLSDTLYFLETWRLKSLDNYPRLRFSRLKLWGIELGLSVQLGVQATACGQQNWIKEDSPPPFLLIRWTARPVIAPQVVGRSSAMAWDETDAKMGSRACSNAPPL